MDAVEFLEHKAHVCGDIRQIVADCRTLLTGGNHALVLRNRCHGLTLGKENCKSEECSRPVHDSTP